MADNIDLDDLLDEQIEEMRLAIFSNKKDKSEDDIFEMCLKQAKYIALNVLFPFDLERDELPLRIAKDWQIRCALFLYNSKGEEGYTSYSENGLSWTKASEYIPKELMNELTPMAGVPR